MGRDFVQVPPTNLVYTTWHTDRSNLLPNTRHAYWEWGLDSSWFSLLLPEWRDYTNKNHQTPIDIAIVPSPQSMLHFEWLTFFLAKICRSVARQFWLPRSLFMACRGWTNQVRLTWNYVGVRNDYRKAGWKALNYLLPVTRMCLGSIYSPSTGWKSALQQSKQAMTKIVMPAFTTAMAVERFSKRIWLPHCLCPERGSGCSEWLFLSRKPICWYFWLPSALPRV